MFTKLTRRAKALPAADATSTTGGTKRKRRTLEDLYRILDENLAILD